MFTIRSISEDGIYYLCKRNYYRFWVTEREVAEDIIFRRAQDAKASLAKLLKVMPEYRFDTFELVEYTYKNGFRTLTAE